jgi:hypothetical protein
MNTRAPMEKARNGVERMADLVVNVVRIIVKVLGKIFGLFLILIAAALLISLIWALFFEGMIMDINTDYLQYYFNNSTQITLAMVGFGLLVLIPLVGMMFTGLRLLINRRIRNRAFRSTMWSLWLIGLVMALVAVYQIKQDLHYERTVRQEFTLAPPSNNVLHISLSDDARRQGNYVSIFDLGTIQATPDSIYARDDVRFNIVRSENNEFVLEENRVAKGRNREEASKKASAIQYRFEQRDSMLVLSEVFSYATEHKIRGQEIQLTLHIPEGASVILDEQMDDIIYDIKNVTNTYDGEMVGHTWAMKPEGLTCIDCTGSSKRTHRTSAEGKLLEFEPFYDISVSGAFEVNIINGDENTVKLSGDDELVKNIDVKQLGKMISIKANNNFENLIRGFGKNKQITIDITLPETHMIEVAGPCEVNGHGLKGDNVTIKLSGAGQGDFSIKSNRLLLQAAGASNIEIAGTTKELNIHSSGASGVDAEGLMAETADVEAVGASHANVNVSKKLDASASGASDVTFEGGATVSSDASGFSSIKPR